MAALNAALLAVVFWQGRLLQQARRQPPPASSPPLAVSAAASSASSAPAFEAAPVPQPKAVSPPPRSAPAVPAGRATVDWQQVESPDYRKYVENLRAIGCPEQTIRDIVTADVVQAYAARRGEVMAARYRDFRYWKSDADEAAAGGNLVKQRRALDEEMGGALQQLLGANVMPPSAVADWKRAELDQQLAFLEPAKRERTRDLLLRGYEIDQQARHLADQAHFIQDPEERQRLWEQYDTKRQALAQLLTPEEYAQADMSASWTAENVRRRLAGFNPTEEEFRLIFGTWRPHDENLVRLHALGENDPGDLHLKIYEKIRAALGEQRYAEYLKAWK